MLARVIKTSNRLERLPALKVGVISSSINFSSQRTQHVCYRRRTVWLYCHASECFATGEAIQTAINELIAMPSVDVSALTAAVAQIQAPLDADEGTEGFQLGQNIVTALTNLTSRVTTLENSDVVAQLQSMVNSLGTDLANETNCAQAAEANLQGQIDALTSDLAALEAVVAALPTASCECAALRTLFTNGIGMGRLGGY